MSSPLSSASGSDASAIRSVQTRLPRGWSRRGMIPSRIRLTAGDPRRTMVLRPLRLDLQHSICVRCQDIEGSDGHSSCGNQSVPQRASASSSKTLICSGPTWGRSRTTASARDRRLQRTRHRLAQCHATGQTRLGHGSRCLPCINSWNDVIGRLPYLSRDPTKYTVALGLTLFRQAFLERARWDMATGSIEGRWLTRRLTG